MNWSSGRDAEWVNPTLQCINSEEVFVLLKSSQFVAHDYVCPYHEAIPDFKVDQHYLVLKKWHNLNIAMEFRCFIKDNCLIAICQRDISAFYEFLIDKSFN